MRAASIYTSITDEQSRGSWHWTQHDRQTPPRQRTAATVRSPRRPFPGSSGGYGPNGEGTATTPTGRPRAGRLRPFPVWPRLQLTQCSPRGPEEPDPWGWIQPAPHPAGPANPNNGSPLPATHAHCAHPPAARHGDRCAEAECTLGVSDPAQARRSRVQPTTLPGRAQRPTSLVPSSVSSTAAEHRDPTEAAPPGPIVAIRDALCCPASQCDPARPHHGHHWAVLRCKAFLRKKGGIRISNPISFIAFFFFFFTLASIHLIVVIFKDSWCVWK